MNTSNQISYFTFADSILLAATGVVNYEDARRVSGKKTSTNMFIEQFVKYMTWVVGDMASRDIDVASPMTHRSYRSINGGK